MSKGSFITFEGIDGAGKSTHLAWAAALLRAHGRAVTVTREPGGTSLGEGLRDLLLHADGDIDAHTEALLMFAARNEHLERVIRPALSRGDIVLCDRFTDASFAYQGGGRGVPAERLRALETWVHRGLQPDLTLYFDLPVATASRRRIADLKAPDRFEREDAGFFERVRTAYLSRAREAPDRIMVVDASKSIPEIQKILENKLLILCQT
jgi:dTMP kinase